MLTGKWGQEAQKATILVLSGFADQVFVVREKASEKIGVQHPWQGLKEDTRVFADV